MDINQDLVAIERIYKAAINTPVYYLSTNLARHWFCKENDGDFNFCGRSFTRPSGC